MAPVRKKDMVSNYIRDYFTSKCSVCGKEFEPKHFAQKICSEKCKKKKEREYRNEYYKKPEIRERAINYVKERDRKLRETPVLVDLFDEKSKFTILDLVKTTGLTGEEVRLSLDRSVRSGSLTKEDRFYKLNPLFSKYFGKSYNEWKKGLSIKNQKHKKKLEKIIKICENCGKKFDTKHKTKKFCDVWCREEFYSKIKKKKPKGLFDLDFR